MSGRERPVMILQPHSLEGVRTDDLGKSWLFKIMEVLGVDILDRLQFGVQETKRVIFDIEDPIVTAVKELDELFITPCVATNPELARRGYALLATLLTSAVGVGQIHKELYRLDALRKIGAAGGKAPRDKVRKWTAEALPIAKAYAASHPNYRKSRLEAHLTGKQIKGAPGERAIRNQISKWQETRAIPYPKK